LQVYASGGSSWIIDSGCTNHMTGEKKMFTSYVKNKDSQDSIIFGDGNQGERELGLNLFLFEFWWLNCPTQII
jgi:hypothetical protein